jgi:shikimate kinase
MKPKLVVTGFMGTGKSRVGRAAAERLGVRFVDSDREIVTHSGKSIAEIFALHGEPHFRALERTTIAALAADAESAVIATGGGALADDDNFHALKRAGVIVCLAARPEVIAARLTRSGEARPKLMEGGKLILERIVELLAERAAVYARADATLDTSDLTIDQAAERLVAIFTALRERRCEPSA